MKKFSFGSFFDKAGAAFLRFPLTVLFAVAATVSSICLVHIANAQAEWSENAPVRLFYWHIDMALYLCMLLSLSIALFSERFSFSNGKKIAAYASSIAVIALYYVFLKDKSDILNAAQFALYVIALHLLVSFSAFPVRGEMNGFWQFNKSLLLRILLAALYSGVIYVGLALAMLAVDRLFGVRINGKYYFDLWLVMAGVFNTWFFLAGIPSNIPSLEQEKEYPKGLKIFTVNVLLSLVSLYLIILYLYTIKIIVTANWPVGWVAYMVIAFAIFGILSFLLIYPLREQESNRWINSYSRMFYFLILPLIVLLFVAIYKRASMYGITENRYFIILLALWLAFIALYSIATRGRNIRSIPLSLSIIALLSSFGPWGAFSVSKKSQLNQMSMILSENKILVDGKVDTVNIHNITDKEKERLESIVEYLDDVHGYQCMQPFFTGDISLKLPARRSYAHRANAEVIIGLMKLNVILTDSNNTTHEYRNLGYGGNSKVMFSTKGFEYVGQFSFEVGPESIHFMKDTIVIRYDKMKKQFELSYKDFKPLFIETNKMFSDAYVSVSDEIGEDKYYAESGNEQWKAKMVFTWLRLHKKENSVEMKDASGYLFVSVRSDKE